MTFDKGMRQKRDKQSMKSRLGSVVWWAGEMALALLFQGVPALIALLPEQFAQAGMVAYFVTLYFLLPMCALIMPAFLTCQKGVNAYAAFFPVGLCLIVFPCYPNGTGVGLICLVIGIVGAVYGTQKRIFMMKKR